MKKIFVTVSFAILAISACSTSTPIPTSTATSTLPPTITASPTDIPPTSIPPTITLTPTPAPQQYYTEGFDKVPENWSITYVPRDIILSEAPIEKVSVTFEDGFLKFDVDKKFLGAFATYNSFEYDDVRVDVRVENHGVNTNDVALMCRYSEKGWYEFNIESSGVYFVNYMRIDEKDSRLHFKSMFEGGAKNIKLDVNEYALSCQGNTLTLYVNGEKVNEIKDDHLTSGKVGVQGFALKYVPVKLYFDWAKISKP